MLNYSIAGITVWISIVSVVWVLSAVLLGGIILIQKGKGGGLGGAFGGAGGGGGLLGTKTGDFLTWVTIGLVFLFFFLAIILVKYGKDTSSDELRMAVPAPGTETVAPEVIVTPTPPAPAPTDTENTDVPTE